MAHILELLREELAEGAMNERLDRALADFVPDAPQPLTQERFHDEIARLVQRSYRDGLWLPRDLTEPQALAEAIALLESSYREGVSVGYEGAYHDAVRGEDLGLDSVLQRLLEIIRARERHKLVQWAVTESLDPLDWHARLEVTRIIIDSIRQWFEQPARSQVALAWQRTLPQPEYFTCQPGQMVDHLPELVEEYLALEATTRYVPALKMKRTGVGTTP